MINIHYKNGFVDTVQKDQYSTYSYDGKMFVLYKDNKAIAFINCECVSGIYINE